MTTSKRVYLDHNASAPLRPSAATAMVDVMTRTGNPSSVHAEGRALRGLIERARASVAALVGCEASQVVFTSGATEANAMILASVDGTIAAAGIEHPSVLQNINDISVLSCNSQGLIDLEGLNADALDPACIAIAAMAANNETGVLQPIESLAAYCRDRDMHLHTDAVQVAGKQDLHSLWTHCDSLSLSAHKIGGPAGVGALVLKDPARISALIGGGGQEQRRRGGTENVSGIIGFGVAAEEAREEIPDWARVRRQRDRLESEMRRLCPDVVIFGDKVVRLANTTCAAVPGVSAELLLMRLDLAGIAISAGSACSSGKVSGSPVLEAMGSSDELSRCAIRISQGLYTTDADLDRFLAAWSSSVVP